jgi:ferrochelatase
MKTAVVLMNLGTPVEPTRKAVRDFLKEFLSDSRVVELFKPLWLIILHCIILVFRTVKVTKAYEKIWTPEGSPLRVITEKQVELLQKELSEQLGSDAPTVFHAMTYTGPYLNELVDRLQSENYEHILILPLYPQYSATTTGSIYDQVTEIVRAKRDIPQIHIIKHYFNYSEYIDALATSVKSMWEKNGRCDRLLMSFHSIPQKYSDEGDPYYFQCKETAEKLAQALALNANEWEMTFQSRLGFSKWLSPYTIVRTEALAKEGVKNLHVISPAFSADCLETLEEISIEIGDLFFASGGEKFQFIPCLNTQPKHIEMMVAIVKNYLPKQ